MIMNDAVLCLDLIGAAHATNLHLTLITSAVSSWVHHEV